MMNFKEAVYFLVVCTFLAGCAASKTTTGSLNKQWAKAQLNNAVAQYKEMAKTCPDGVMPRSFTNGKLNTCTSENWVAGFYPGTLLYLYEATGNKEMYAEAMKRIVQMDKQQYNSGTHDLGFMMFCSYGTLNNIEPKDSYKQILINSAQSLAKRFNPTIGCIRSWGKIDEKKDFRVIIDNMMNLELLFWAAKQIGDKNIYNIAVTHANTTMKNHFRPDYSSYHVVFYDQQTGGVVKKQTAQGAADESAWARGQAWGLYGYTLMYRETKDSKYLQQAQSIAKCILSHPNLPTDKIPYWDFNAPGIPNAPRDASAAAVIASALIELAGYSNESLAVDYMSVVQTILKNLSTTEYTAAIGDNGNFILKHSVAHYPKGIEIDSPLPYADYYYIEAIVRYMQKMKW